MTGPAIASAKFALDVHCTCPRQPSAPVRGFVETARLLRERLGALPPEILALPLCDVRCRENPKCKANIPLLVSDLLGYGPAE